MLDKKTEWNRVNVVIEEEMRNGSIRRRNANLEVHIEISSMEPNTRLAVVTEAYPIEDYWSVADGGNRMVWKVLIYGIMEHEGRVEVVGHPRVYVDEDGYSKWNLLHATYVATTVAYADCKGVNRLQALIGGNQIGI